MTKLPEHLFVSSTDGALHDTRIAQWHKQKPLRTRYEYHSPHIPSGLIGTALVRAALRAGGFAWPGGYTLFFVTSDGETLSFKSVRENLRQVLDSTLHNARDGWRVVGIDSVEGCEDEVYCAHSGEQIL